jgi:DNA-directed RNA polymerase specialized sigma24 family protein
MSMATNPSRTREASRKGADPAAADAEDGAQSIWLKLLVHLGSLRDPAALPGWLATTTLRECAASRA